MSIRSTRAEPHDCSLPPPSSYVSLTLDLNPRSTAHQIITITACSTFIVDWGCYAEGEWRTDDGQSYSFDANNNCHDPKIPVAKRVCFDWRRSRAHAELTSGEKYCFTRLTPDVDVDACACDRHGIWPLAIGSFHGQRSGRISVIGFEFLSDDIHHAVVNKFLHI